MNNNRLEPLYKARALMTDFTDNLFNAGHTISKPMIKKCVEIFVDNVIDEVQAHLDEKNQDERFAFWLEVKNQLETL